MRKRRVQARPEACVHSRRTPGGSEGLEEALFLLKSKRLSKKKRVRVEDGTIGTINWLPPYDKLPSLLHSLVPPRARPEANNNKRVIDRATDDLATIQQRPPEAPAQSNLEDRRDLIPLLHLLTLALFFPLLSSSPILGLFTKTNQAYSSRRRKHLARFYPVCRTHCKPKKLHATVRFFLAPLVGTLGPLNDRQPRFGR